MLQRTASLLLVTLALMPLSASAQTPPPPAQPESTPPGAPAAPSADPSAEPPPPAVTPAPEQAPTTEPLVAPTAPELTEPPPSATAVEPPAEEAPEFPKKLAVGTTGFFSPSSLLQGWVDVNHTEDATSLNFRLRRAEIKVQGEIIPKLIGYSIMIDPARALESVDTEIEVDGEPVTFRTPNGNSSIFQDFFITFISDYMDVSFGQFKIPVSYEGYNSSSKLLFAERAPVAREFGDRRDIGLRLAKTFDYFGYSAGIFNGSGQNNFDGNASKDLGLRLELYPVKGLLIGGVVYASVGDREDPSTKDRYEADLRFESGGFLFQGEFIHARNGGGDAAVEGNGFYAALAYAFLDGKLQPAVRVGYLDPDSDQNLDGTGSKDELLHVDVGLTYYILKQEAKVLLNYYRFQYDDKIANNEIILAAQVSF